MLDFPKDNAEQMSAICSKMVKLLVKKQTLKQHPPKQVAPRLYIGNYANAISHETLAHHNISLVISCLNIDERDRAPGIQYHFCLVKDKAEENIQQYFPQVYDKVESVLKGSDEKGVLINCFSGKSRSVTLMASYLMKKNNMNFQEVYELLKEKAPDAEPNEGFMGQLCEYAEKIEEERLEQQKLAAESTQKQAIDLLDDAPPAEEDSAQKQSQRIMQYFEDSEPAKQLSSPDLLEEEATDKAEVDLLEDSPSEVLESKDAQPENNLLEFGEEQVLEAEEIPEAETAGEANQANLQGAPDDKQLEREDEIDNSNKEETTQHHELKPAPEFEPELKPEFEPEQQKKEKQVHPQNEDKEEVKIQKISSGEQDLAKEEQGAQNDQTNEKVEGEELLGNEAAKEVETFPHQTKKKKKNKKRR